MKLYNRFSEWKLNPILVVYIIFIKSDLYRPSNNKFHTMLLIISFRVHTEKMVLLDQPKFFCRNKIIFLLFVQQNCFVEPAKIFCWVSLLVWQNCSVGLTKLFCWSNKMLLLRQRNFFISAINHLLAQQNSLVSLAK